MLQLGLIEFQRHFIHVLSGDGDGGDAFQVFQGRADIILGNTRQLFQIIRAAFAQTERDDRQ
ncbi:hypothetical protein D3C73_1402140 [compost metagenome]